ncbi:hypothetical protein C8R45DRAFT_1087654 [Mycena sanguinolenta]|nr:hypothetical protein C8R45DRAFT_1087654 [Mycena sanguinolenta]
MFSGRRPSRKVKIVQISGGTGGSGGGGGINGGGGGLGEGPRVKISSAVTVANFIRNNYSSAPTVPSGFRTIPLGDIYLQYEIRLHDDSGVVTLRRLHSAKIEGSDVMRAVAIYQGDGAEQQWRRDLVKYRAAARDRGHGSTAPVARLPCPSRWRFFQPAHGTATARAITPTARGNTAVKRFTHFPF